MDVTNADLALDLTGIDAGAVSLAGDVQAESLYGVTPAGSVTLAESAAAARTCGGYNCCCITCGRPSFCLACH